MLDVVRSTVTPMSLVVTTEYLRGLATLDRVEKAAATAGRAGGGRRSAVLRTRLASSDSTRPDRTARCLAGPAPRKIAIGLRRRAGAELPITTWKSARSCRLQSVLAYTQRQT